MSVIQGHWMVMMTIFSVIQGQHQVNIIQNSTHHLQSQGKIVMHTTIISEISLQHQTSKVQNNSNNYFHSIF